MRKWHLPAFLIPEEFQLPLILPVDAYALANVSLSYIVLAPFKLPFFFFFKLGVWVSETMYETSKGGISMSYSTNGSLDFSPVSFFEARHFRGSSLPDRSQEWR